MCAGTEEARSWGAGREEWLRSFREVSQCPAPSYVMKAPHGVCSLLLPSLRP